jgi:hypothetical protein
MMDFGENVIVTKARNLAGGASKREDYDIIPLKITSFVVDGSEDVNPCSASREHLISAVKSAVSNFQIQDLNDAEQTIDIMEQVENFEERQFKISKVKRSNKTYSDVPRKISESIANKVPIELGAGCCTKGNKEITLFVFYEDYPEFGIRKGEVYLDARTQKASRAQVIDKKIARTTGAEIFGRKLEEEEEPIVQQDSQDFKVKITTTTETTLKVKKTPTTIRVKKVNTKTKTKIRIIDNEDAL